MANERTNTFKLGLFVLSGVVVLVLGLYLLGRKGDLFTRTIAVQATFREVNGLRDGNNVRYAGIDVGTVKAITIVSDTEVVVSMLIRRDAAGHIRQNALASIASDGLMGNKLVKLDPAEGPGAPLMEGTMLGTSVGIDTDAMLKVLGTSNDNLVAITTDLRELTHRLNTANGPLTLLTDTLLVDDVRSIITDLSGAAANTRAITARADRLVQDLQAGEGALGVLLSDTAAERQVRDMLAALGSASDSLSAITANISRFSQRLDAPGGLGHTLTRDTAVVVQVKRVVANLDSSAYNLNEDLRALQRNWFFRKYFKEKKKEAERRAP